MISHLGVFRRGLVEESRWFRKGFEGSQDYDLVLRVTERIGSDQILHLPRVLYHWRAHRGNTSANSEAKPYALRSCAAGGH